MNHKKVRALLKMKAAKDRREDHYHPELKDNTLGRNKTRLELWESTSKTRLWHWTKRCSAWRIRASLDFWPETLLWKWSSMAGAGFLQLLWEKPICEGVWPYLDPWDSVCLRTASVEWNVPRYGPHGELFSSRVARP